ncbi:terpene synthase-like [Danaus plexippus]|uniref:terpene synthase-like n=1 Tax=Danaus plexippus TaxID=13037 RepID=UPI002AB1BDBC|nr:terpene synthase-like [Danaus plexippus]
MANKINKELLNLDEVTNPSSLQHLIQIRGKQLREQLARSFNYWLKVPDIQLKNAIDTMTMLLDDVQDNSLTRRGLPSAHFIYNFRKLTKMGIMRQSTKILELKKYCLSLLEKSGGMQYTRDILIKMDKKLRTEVFCRHS